MTPRAAVLAVAVFAVAACTGPTPGPLPPARAASPAAVKPSPGRCVAHDGLPDTACTPGAVNPDVTQGNIASTICRRGWTATIRPPRAYTTALKRRQIVEYGAYAGKSLAAYEEDHLIPLELGGAPRDPRNLWPEAGASRNPKDGVEDAGRRSVCAHRLTLTDAQGRIAGDWRAFGRSLGLHV